MAKKLSFQQLPILLLKVQYFYQHFLQDLVEIWSYTCKHRLQVWDGHFNEASERPKIQEEMWPCDYKKGWGLAGRISYHLFTRMYNNKNIFAKIYLTVLFPVEGIEILMHFNVGEKKSANDIALVGCQSIGN